MPAANETSNDDETFDAPGFQRALRALYRAPNEVPTEIDRRVLAHANRRFRLVRWGRASRWLSAAAAAALVLAGIYFAIERSTHTRQFDDLDATALREDIDGSGRVDILDAFRLARLIARDTSNDSRFDVNRDELVDQRDVEAIAESAVRLEKRERP